MANPEWDNYRPQTWIDRMVEVVEKQRPKDCTGFYVTSSSIIFGKRTNRRKAPKNFVFFDDAQD